jgi:hypothetical protein
MAWLTRGLSGRAVLTYPADAHFLLIHEVVVPGFHPDDPPVTAQPATESAAMPPDSEPYDSIIQACPHWRHKATLDNHPTLN